MGPYCVLAKCGVWDGGGKEGRAKAKLNQWVSMAVPQLYPLGLGDPNTQGCAEGGRGGNNTAVTPLSTARRCPPPEHGTAPRSARHGSAPPRRALRCAQHHPGTINTGRGAPLGTAASPSEPSPSEPSGTEPNRTMDPQDCTCAAGKWTRQDSVWLGSARLVSLTASFLSQVTPAPALGRASARTAAAGAAVRVSWGLRGSLTLGYFGGLCPVVLCPSPLGLSWRPPSLFLLEGNTLPPAPVGPPPLPPVGTPTDTPSPLLTCSCRTLYEQPPYLHLFL